MGGPKNWEYYNSFATSINNAGQAVGFDGSGACLFDMTGNMDNRRLGGLSGGGRGWASCINDKGQIVGAAQSGTGGSHATLFDPSGGGDNRDLGTLEGKRSTATCINNAGQIVGYSEECACLFDATGDGHNKSLGGLGGGRSEAYSINDSGQIVGYAEVGMDDPRAVLFDPTGNGDNIDLNTLIAPSPLWKLEYAFAINDSGWIVGAGMCFSPWGEHAFLLKPVPEPGALSVMGGGLLVFLGRGRLRAA